MAGGWARGWEPSFHGAEVQFCKMEHVQGMAVWSGCGVKWTWCPWTVPQEWSKMHILLHTFYYKKSKMEQEGRACAWAPHQDLCTVLGFIYSFRAVTFFIARLLGALVMMIRIMIMMTTHGVFMPVLSSMFSFLNFFCPHNHTARGRRLASPFYR